MNTFLSETIQIRIANFMLSESCTKVPASGTLRKERAPSMELLIMVLMLLMLIGASNVLNRFIPFVPVPIIQIALGVAAAYMPGLHHVPLDPELFLVLFIAPLLFNDGKVIPRDELWRLRKYILLMALGLVFATVLLAGPFIHWLIPAIPLAVSFALAAILSPTDAVAVGSLSSRVKLPGSMMRLLEGEALMNDASGLVAFNFAIAAALSGEFSLPRAVGSFIVIAAGGLLLGAALGFAVIWLRLFLRRLGIEDVTLHMLIIIVTPFVIFLAAEESHVSGILAVVAAGLVHSIERERLQSSSSSLRVVSDSTWSVILYVLNGLVFLLLGLEIPEVVAAVWEDPVYNNARAIGYIFVITALLLIIRYAWVWLTNRNFRSALLTTLSGVRGALTLAAAFSIPTVFADGRPFPERSLMLYICAGVILLTLVSASVFLPLLTRGANKPEGRAAETRGLNEREARIRVLEAGLNTIREEMTEDNAREAVDMISEYNRRLQRTRLEGRVDYRKEWRTAVGIRLEAMKAEREAVSSLLREGKITPAMGNRLLTSLGQMESILSNRLIVKRTAILLWFGLKRLFPGKGGQSRMSPAHPKWESFKQVKLLCIRDAIERLQELETPDNRDSIGSVLADYREMELRLRNDWFRDEGKAGKSEQRRELELKAIQAERNEIQAMFEQGDIDRHLTGCLRSDVNYREASVFESRSVHAEGAH